MDTHIVVLGSGNSGTLAANRLRELCDNGTRITVIDRRDTRDPETELLTALGLFGPHALNAPEHLRLRDGIEFRHVEAASVDVRRHEVCLTDGTTVAYDALVVATGSRRRPGRTGRDAVLAGARCVARSPGLGDPNGIFGADPLTGRSRTLPDVYAIGGAAGSPDPFGPPGSCADRTNGTAPARAPRRGTPGDGRHPGRHLSHDERVHTGAPATEQGTYRGPFGPLQLTAEAERLAVSDRDRSRESRSWVRDGSHDGLPGAALGPRDAAGRLPVRDFTAMRPAVHRPSARFEPHPLIGVLSTPHDTRAGRVWPRA
jgi:pyridine nucleotide-disulfide oxidoreductase